jgi:hypothetical protein
MLWNQTVELNSTGDPVSNELNYETISKYINEFVSDKSQLESIISDNYKITINLNEMDLTGKYLILVI